jgi:hypothetical protein
VRKIVRSATATPIPFANGRAGISQLNFFILISSLVVLKEVAILL